VQWSTQLPSSLGAGLTPYAPDPIAIAADGTIYVGMTDGLFAVDASGLTRWRVLRGTSVYSLFIVPTAPSTWRRETTTRHRSRAS